MSLENEIFAKEYHYRPKQVNKFLVMIKFGNTERRRLAFRNLVFRMMKDIVVKNITNYLNLLNNTPVPSEDFPPRDELVSECFLVFDKCIEKYKVLPSHNFYFYFNKSLSRKFFKDYQRALVNDKIEMTEAIYTCHPDLRQREKPDTIGILMDINGFSDLERRITISRLQDMKPSDFLKKNPDVTSVQYGTTLKRIKEILMNLQEQGEL